MDYFRTLGAAAAIILGFIGAASAWDCDVYYGVSSGDLLPPAAAVLDTPPTMVDNGYWEAFYWNRPDIGYAGFGAGGPYGPDGYAVAPIHGAYRVAVAPGRARLVLTQGPGVSRAAAARVRTGASVAHPVHRGRVWGHVQPWGGDVNRVADERSHPGIGRVGD